MMLSKKNLYISSLLIFLLGLFGGLFSLKISFGLILLCLFAIFIIKEPSSLLYLVVGYAFVDFLFRNISFLQGFSSMWDEALIVLILFLYVANCIWKNKITLRTSPVDIYVILLLGICVFLLFMVSPDFRIALEGFRVYAEYALWFFIGLNLIKNIEQFKRLMWFYIFMLFLISLYGIYQYIIGVEIPTSWIDSAFETYIKTRVYSIIGSPNVLGSLLAMSIPIVLPLAFNEKNIPKKTFYWIVIISMIVSLGFTFSRGAWLAFFASLIIYGFFVDKKAFAMIFAIVLSVPLFAPSILMRILYMLSPEYAKSSAKGGRIIRWINAFELFKQNLIFGVGFGRFGGAVAKRNIADSYYVDNFYLKSAVEMGLIGVIVLILTFFIVVLFGARVIKSLKSSKLKLIGSGLLVGLTTVLLHNFVENIFEVPMMSSYFWLFSGFLFALPYLEKEENTLYDGGS